MAANLYYGPEGDLRLQRKSTCWFCDSAEYLAPFSSKAIICRNSPPQISRAVDPCCSGSPPSAAAAKKGEEVPAASASPYGPQTCIDRVIDDGSRYFCKHFQRKAAIYLHIPPNPM